MRDRYGIPALWSVVARCMKISFSRLTRILYSTFTIYTFYLHIAYSTYIPTYCTIRTVYVLASDVPHHLDIISAYSNETVHIAHLIQSSCYSLVHVFFGS